MSFRNIWNEFFGPSFCCHCCYTEGVFRCSDCCVNGLCDPRAPESGRSKRFPTALRNGGLEFKPVLAEAMVWHGAHVPSVMLRNEKRHFPQLDLNVAAAQTSVKSLSVSLRKWSFYVIHQKTKLSYSFTWLQFGWVNVAKQTSHMEWLCLDIVFCTFTCSVFICIHLNNILSVIMSSCL